jgi:hypothetical protein
VRLCPGFWVCDCVFEVNSFLTRVPHFYCIRQGDTISRSKKKKLNIVGSTQLRKYAIVVGLTQLRKHVIYAWILRQMHVWLWPNQRKAYGRCPGLHSHLSHWFMHSLLLWQGAACVVKGMIKCPVGVKPDDGGCKRFCCSSIISKLLARRQTQTGRDVYFEMTDSIFLQ